MKLVIFHFCAISGCELLNRNMSDVVKPLIELFNSNSFTPADIIRVCAILDSNSFRVDGLGNRGLFALASMLNHDCGPNARVSFDRDAGLTLRYFESRTIFSNFEKSKPQSDHLAGWGKFYPKELSKLEGWRYPSALFWNCFLR